MTSVSAALVYLGRDQAMGEGRRVDSWRRVLDAAGYTPVPVRLLPGERSRPRDWVRQAAPVATGATVPESLAWSARAAHRAVAALDPGVVVCVSARAYHPSLGSGSWVVVLDFVDQLSRNYRDRSGIAPDLRHRMLFRAVSAGSARFERRPLPALVRVAAGWDDAARLSADWLPNVVELPAVAATVPDVDLVFVGTLSYLPNSFAVERLGRVWPAISRRRPGTTMLIAGARPSPSIRALAARHGWEVRGDFDDLASVLGRARLSVAPLDHATGMQNKILEAAAHGLATVADAKALAGLDPDFPARVITSDDELVDAVVSLLDDPGGRAELARAARDHVAARYAPAPWGAWLRRRIEGHIS